GTVGQHEEYGPCIISDKRCTFLTPSIQKNNLVSTHFVLHGLASLHSFRQPINLTDRQRHLRESWWRLCHECQRRHDDARSDSQEFYRSEAVFQSLQPTRQPFQVGHSPYLSCPILLQNKFVEPPTLNRLTRTPV